MLNHALKSIHVGKNSGRPLDPSDIEFSFYSYGVHIDEDGNIDKYPSFEIITHKYDECSGHHVSSQQISHYKDANIAQIYLVCAELSQIVEALTLNCDEDDYIELLFESLSEWIEDGYKILSQYDLEVEE